MHYSDVISDEKCSVCRQPASHKIAEDMGAEDYNIRHPFTAYLCCGHFAAIMGPVAREFCKGGHEYETTCV